jgi:hypothetical protein
MSIVYILPSQIQPPVQLQSPFLPPFRVYHSMTVPNPAIPYPNYSPAAPSSVPWHNTTTASFHNPSLAQSTIRMMIQKRLATLKLATTKRLYTMYVFHTTAMLPTTRMQPTTKLQQAFSTTQPSPPLPSQPPRISVAFHQRSALSQPECKPKLKPQIREHNIADVFPPVWVW